MCEWGKGFREFSSVVFQEALSLLSVLNMKRSTKQQKTVMMEERITKKIDKERSKYTLSP